jgi:lipopolysaccharide export LptBFGC system permease protein LptF
MSWMFYRYIMGELLRVFALSATVLVLVVAFGAAIKPLAGDDLAGPLQAAKYIMLAIVPMLQFALPFSAGFAATVVLHRMTTDNEILAASVSGLSYRRILMPIVAMGLVLLVIMVLLTQTVIPRFWESLQKMIARDVTRMIQTSIQKGRPVRFADVQIHADKLMVQQSPPDTGAQTRLILLRVVAAKVDRTGRIVWDVAAKQAIVDVHRLEGSTYLKIALSDTVGFDSETGQLAHAPQIMDGIAIPDPLHDDPVFMPRSRLLWLRDHPDDYVHVIEAKEDLARSMRGFDVWNELARAIETDGSVVLTGGDRRLVIEAGRFDDGWFRPGEGPFVVVNQFDEQDRPIRRINALGASVRTAVGSTLTDPTVDLVLIKCQVVDLRAVGATNDRDELIIPGLSLPTLTGEDPSQLPYEELLTRAQGRAHGVQKYTDRLNRVVINLQRAITTRLLRRYALSVTAMLLLVLGATLAMWLRNGTPLVVFMWAFLPAVVDMILIASGDHTARAGAMTSGILLMWSGNAMLMGTLLFVYSRLARN